MSGLGQPTWQRTSLGSSLRFGPIAEGFFQGEVSKGLATNQRTMQGLSDPEGFVASEGFVGCMKAWYRLVRSPKGSVDDLRTIRVRGASLRFDQLKMKVRLSNLLPAPLIQLVSFDPITPMPCLLAKPILEMLQNLLNKLRTVYNLSFRQTHIENPNFVNIQAAIPRLWPAKNSDSLYFCVEDVESYAWTPRTPKSVEKRASYEHLKFGFLEREGRRVSSERKGWWLI
ncbi:hypothetical protein E3N88_28846 [Mikania micrantha]|uniref:Uncharacterized protein n=1 Tax=Mikania micrantha TaxID=192012 RepID=A0A5N6N3F6_9ASTR|nr:hypothetical protein E3N88_28846 [Mikania micrantha]